jgi:dipeptidyl aminopeptidase/acylaminoacyl peptidase
MRKFSFFSVVALSLFVIQPIHAQTSPSGKVLLTPYLSMRGAGAPALSPDGKWIVYTSSVSGTPQLWKIPAAAASNGYAFWPDQLTFYSEAIGGAEFSPDGNWILFNKDIGGNEKHQLFLMPMNGGTPDTLTHNPNAIFSGEFSHDGKNIIYTSNERNDAFFDVYMMDMATRTSKLVHQSDHSNSLIGMSPDDKWIIISRDSGNANDYVFAIDLEHDKPTDEPRLLTPHTEDANYGGFTISPDSKTLYFFTNQGQEYMSRASIAFTKPDAEVKFRDHSSWDIDQDVFSEDGRIEVMSRNIDGMSMMSLFDVKAHKELPTPKLPENGFISNLQVSRDGNIVAFNFTSPREVGAIYVFDRKRNVSEPITRPNYAGLDPAAFATSELIHYPSFDGHMIPAYFYQATAKHNERAPVIVMMHGGPESQERPWFNPLAQYFVARGYGVLIPNVRGSTGYGKAYSAADNTTKRMTSVRDMEFAGRWLAKQPTVDSNKRVIYGGSYGGFMSLAGMTMQPDIWTAGVDLFGIANFLSFLRNTGAWRAQNRMAEYGNPDRDSAFLYDISPINHVDNIKHPLFVYQGKNDPRVPVSEAEQIVEAVKKRGIEVEYILLPDEGHGLSKRDNRVKVITAIVDFLDRVLK